jgi:uncharacterized membrane protein ArfC
MDHVQWPLVILSAVIGLGLTVALMIGRVTPEPPAHAVTAKPAVKSGTSAANKASAAEPGTTKISVGTDPPTTNVRFAKESPTTKIRVADDAPTTHIPVVDGSPTTFIGVEEESSTTFIRVQPYASYGPGSARADSDGNGPAGWLVKGRSDTRLYYTPDDPNYDTIRAQVWFQDEGSAKRAFFTPWRKSAKKR